MASGKHIEKAKNKRNNAAANMAAKRNENRQRRRSIEKEEAMVAYWQPAKRNQQSEGVARVTRWQWRAAVAVNMVRKAAKKKRLA